MLEPGGHNNRTSFGSSTALPRDICIANPAQLGSFGRVIRRNEIIFG